MCGTVYKQWPALSQLDNFQEQTDQDSEISVSIGFLSMDGGGSAIAAFSEVGSF